MEKYMELGSMDTYYEQAVKRKMQSSTVSALIFGMIAIILLLVASVWLTFTVMSWMFPFAILMLGIGIYLIRYIILNSRVEYEYTFVIGELRISRIKGKTKRKTVTYFDVKSIDDIGKFINPETGKKNIDTMKYRIIFHAAVDDKNLDTYYMVIHDKVTHQPALLLFTPNDRTLQMIQPYFSVPLKKKFIQMKKDQEKFDKEFAENVAALQEEIDNKNSKKNVDKNNDKSNDKNNDENKDENKDKSNNENNSNKNNNNKNNNKNKNRSGSKAKKK